MNELVSVIIPVYNSEKYLSKCLESIFFQSYKNIEVILINDGSTDNSKEIYSKYLEDSRLVKVEQNNRGISQARNKGIDIAKGEYILFVDSDDWIEKDCIFKLMNIAKNNNSEIVIFPYISEYKNNSIERRLFEKEIIFCESEIQSLLLRLFGLKENELRNPLTLENFNPVWGKLYKSDLIKSKKFIDLKLIGSSEDCLFNIEVIFEAKKVVYFNDTYYHYRKNNSDSFTRNYRKDLFFQWINLYDIMKNFIVEKNLNKNFEEALKNRIILNIFALTLNICDSNLSIKQKYLELKKLLNEDFYKDKFNKFKFMNLNLFWRSYYYLCKTKQTSLVISTMLFLIKLRGKIKK
ncbi:MAG: glycosyltransferase family 2 protein [Fusobacteriaceae bacterium]